MSTIWGIDPDTSNITIVRNTNGKLRYDVVGAKGRRAEDRFEALHAAFRDFVRTTNQPQWTYLEKLMRGPNANSTIAQAMVVGMIRATLWEAGRTHSIVDPGTWKKATVGTGNAGKPEVKAWAIARYSLPDDLAQDVYDAAGIASWGAAAFGGGP